MSGSRPRASASHAWGIFVRGDDATVRLGPGDGVDVSTRSEVGPVVRWGRVRIDLFARLLGPDW